MQDFMDLLNQVGGDSLILTGAINDAETDWPPGLIYRSDGGQELEHLISQPYKETLVGEEITVVTHVLITNPRIVDDIIDLYATAGPDDVVGVVTHVYNFEDDPLFFRQWLEFIQGKNCKTVRKIMRERRHGTGVEESPFQNHPSRYTLDQNSPNPFNASTIFRYYLEKPSLVTLTVYNLIGERIAVLIDDHRPAGRHSVIWNAQGMSTGLYLCRLEADGYTATKKLIFQK